MSVTEVTPDPVVEDKAEDVAAPSAATEEIPIESQDDILDVLEPNAEPREVKLTYGGVEKSYLQAPLTYFRKMEFFGLVGRTLDYAMEGEDGLTVNRLFDSNPTSVSDISAADFGDLDSFLSLVSKVAHYAPDFLKDCYVIWLNVPKAERPWAREALEDISDDEGEAIIVTFVDQNWEDIERFFVERLPAIARRVQRLRKKND